MATFVLQIRVEHEILFLRAGLPANIHNRYTHIHSRSVRGAATQREVSYLPTHEAFP